ncbi:MAG: hypothetical protein OHK93_004772 [Ramalina farinacea]|uniref:RRM domain-containing protein n=1 Tax=Ramalina farinacea TaxID=258253 RepID=A0AA43QUS2_9LECA|nr:hypothetical protein [Ramalina farinacea]
MGDPVSATRLYLGNLPRDVTKEDVTNFFTEGPGTISEIKLMNGFGFVEYEDAADARDVVPHFRKHTLVRSSEEDEKHILTSNPLLCIDGMDMKGQRVTVQFARGSRPRDYPMPDRTHPRPRRTAFRLSITGLPGDTSWQDLKDFARRSALDVVYSEVGRDRDGKGFVEFETAADLKVATDKLDNQDFKGSNVHCFPDIQDEIPGRNDRYRSRSPPPFRRGGYPPSRGYDDYRGPPPRRGYTPPREDYRRRSPPPRDYDYSRGYRSPPPRGPPRGPPIDEPYPPPRGGYREPDPYGGAPPRRGGYDDGYGGANGYDRAPRRTPPPPRGYGGYDERMPPRYW